MLKINYGVCKEELKSLVVYNLEKSRNITIFFLLVKVSVHLKEFKEKN